MKKEELKRRSYTEEDFLYFGLFFSVIFTIAFLTGYLVGIKVGFTEEIIPSVVAILIIPPCFFSILGALLDWAREMKRRKKEWKK